MELVDLGAATKLLRFLGFTRLPWFFQANSRNIPSNRSCRLVPHSLFITHDYLTRSATAVER
jgi:hypothetical protein